MITGWLAQNSATISSLTAIAAFIISVASLQLAWSQRPEDPTPIIRIVEEEAIYTRERDVDATVRLFTDDANIRDIGYYHSSPPRPSQSWSGKNRIRARYEMIAERAFFPELVHVSIVVTFDPSGQVATAISSTQGKFVWDHGPEEIIDTINGERWSFVQVEGAWKIKDVSFHLPPAAK